MKTLIILSSIFLLSACSPPSATELVFPVLPEGLKDCKFYRVENELSTMQVVRCPNSYTSYTYSSGKSTIHGSTLELQEDPKEVARREALKKLSAEEIDLLGIKK